MTEQTPEIDQEWVCRFVTPPDLHMTPGTVLRDAEGRYWLVRDDGQTAVGTNGGVLVDLRRGEPIFRPELTAEEESNDD